MATHRLLLECLPASENVSRLRAEGKITADMTSVWIGFGAIELKREVRLEHRRFPNGGSWTFFLCPDAKDACAVSGSATAGQCARIAAAISIAFHTDHQHSVRQR